MQHRRDHRTKAEFAKDIQEHTNKETYLAGIFQAEMIHRGHSITMADNGVDNSGKLLKRATTDADYSVCIDWYYSGMCSEFLAEIKCSPNNTTCTFKVNSLKQYVKRGEYILLFYNAGDIVKNKTINPKAMWALVSPESISKMIEQNKPFSFRPFGGKQCVQIKKPEFWEYFESHPLLHLV